MKNILVVFFIAIFFIGCSSREYYEPKVDDVKFLPSQKIDKTPLESGINTFNKKGASLNNQKLILASGIQKEKLKDDYTFINVSENKIISANSKGGILFGSQEINLDKIVVAVSIKDNLAAIVFMDNSIALYDINKKQMLFKEYYKESLVNDIRISNPIFFTDIVLYPTLDGKVIVVSLKEPKVLRTIIVDTNGKFNNISFFDLVNNSLIASTANQIISLSGSDLLTKKFEIRDIIKKGEYIYIATLDGQILKLDTALNILAKTKFKYAKIYSLGFKDDKIFALESQGYLLELNGDLNKQKIYSFKFNNDVKSVLLGDKIYFQQTRTDTKTLQEVIEDFYITLP